MSDDITAIEVEARAYVESYIHHYASGTPGAFEYLSAMLKVIDGLRSSQREVRAAAISEAAQKAENYGHSNGRIRASHKHVAAAIRAIAEP